MAEVGVGGWLVNVTGLLSRRVTTLLQRNFGRAGGVGVVAVPGEVVVPVTGPGAVGGDGEGTEAVVDAVEPWKIWSTTKTAMQIAPRVTRMELGRVPGGGGSGVGGGLPGGRGRPPVGRRLRSTRLGRTSGCNEVGRASGSSELSSGKPGAVGSGEGAADEGGLGDDERRRAADLALRFAFGFGLAFAGCLGAAGAGGSGAGWGSPGPSSSSRRWRSFS